ncbi:hypothetical protein BDC45DRAFT_572223 [Circinella umbellata]|nr:hypothetical protein BDC45DRAFT_572223 [Circinella umbellata]
MISSSNSYYYNQQQHDHYHYEGLRLMRDLRTCEHKPLEYHLSRHRRTHTGERLHVCEYNACGNKDY